jgi:NAD(P)H-hydrate epimerase
VTLGHYKRGLVTGRAADYTGQVLIAEIGIPRQIPGITPSAGLVEASDVVAGFPRRNPAAHKGNFGHVVVLAGPLPQLGAAVIAATGALHAGAGLVSVAGDSSVLPPLRGMLPPEIMLEEGEASLTKARSAVVVLGPGLGQGEEAKRWLTKALDSPHPLVLDADALNLLAATGQIPLVRKQASVLMTPHPKEAARLLQGTVEEIEGNRYDAIQKLVQRTGAVCLLKGRGTLVRAPGSPLTYVINEGTSALAKGGSGDLLAGAVAAFVSQGLSPEKALAFGSFVHGRAAQFWEERGEDARSLTPTQVAKALSAVLKDLT